MECIFPTHPCTAQVNYLGAYALTRLLEPTLQRSAPSTVVNVSSIMHRCVLICACVDVFVYIMCVYIICVMILICM